MNNLFYFIFYFFNKRNEQQSTDVYINTALFKESDSVFIIVFMRMDVNTTNFRKLFVSDRLRNVLYVEHFKNFFVSSPVNDAVVFYSTKRIEFSNNVEYEENGRKCSYKLSTTINYIKTNRDVLLDNYHTFYYNFSFFKKDNTIELTMDCRDTGRNFETEICDLYYSEGFLINLESEISFEEVRETQKRVYLTISNLENDTEEDDCNIDIKSLYDIDVLSFTNVKTMPYKKMGGYVQISDSQKFNQIFKFTD